MNPLPTHIASLQPYESARSLWKGDGWIFIDANESPTPGKVTLDAMPPLNRYPDPTADALRDAIATHYELRRQNLMMANGSDELIDLLVRAFVRPGRKVVSLSPSYGMYRVSADSAGMEYVSVPLRADFSVDEEAIATALKDADLLFLCSPNNPTGTVLETGSRRTDIPVCRKQGQESGRQECPPSCGSGLIERIAATFPGIVCIDEAYGEFADAQGLASSIELVRRGAENLIVLRTFSKAFAAAGIRLGYGIACASIIDVLLRMKPPYNVNVLTQAAGMSLWNRRPVMLENVRGLIAERERLMQECRRLGCEVFASVANFFLLEPPTGMSANDTYESLMATRRLIVRRFADRPGMENVLRITVGLPSENDIFLTALSEMLQ